jgi:hypothetical protein
MLLTVKNVRKLLERKALKIIKVFYSLYKKLKLYLRKKDTGQYRLLKTIRKIKNIKNKKNLHFYS